jgi:hypothetical protein
MAVYCFFSDNCPETQAQKKILKVKITIRFIMFIIINFDFRIKTNISAYRIKNILIRMVYIPIGKYESITVKFCISVNN